MKIISFTVVCLLLSFQGYSQKNQPQLDLTQIRPKPVSLTLPDKKFPTNSNLRKLVVIDARFDTTTLGFYSAASGRSYSLVTKLNIADEIDEYLADYLGIRKTGGTGARTILMVLRKLWITPELQQDPGLGLPANQPPTGGVITKVDFYERIGEKNEYLPLYRFDSIYSGMRKMNRQATSYLENALIGSVSKLLAHDFPAREEGTVLSLEDIRTFSRKSADNPINHALSYKKGVYQNYDEFKLNNPSIESYTITKDRLTQTIFFKDDKGGEYPQRDLWGYSDGKHLYIKSGDNYFELEKKQGTFISLASRPLQAKRSVKTGDVVLFGPVWGSVGPQHKKVSYNLKLRIYELDMDTGELY